jgi:adenylate cyclase
MSLRMRLGASIVAMVVFTALALGTASTISARSRMRRDLRSTLGTVAAALAASVDPEEHAALLAEADMDGPVYAKYRRIFRKVREEDPRIAYLYTMRRAEDGSLYFVLDSGEGEDDFSPLGSIYEAEDDSLSAAFQEPFAVRVEEEFSRDQWGLWLSASAPILRADGSLEGVLGIDIAADDILTTERNLALLMLALTAGVVALGALAAVLLARRIVHPLVLLSEDMGRIKTLDLQHSLRLKSRIIEVQMMESALENMKKSLRSFKRYVPSDLVIQLIGKEAEASLGTELVPLTVLFSDLENFTSVSEKIGKDLVAQVLGPYLKYLSEALQTRGATVDKFIGDAVMAFWGAPNPCPDQAVLACRAALESRRGLETIRGDWRIKGIEPMKTRIGINTGDCIVGNIGYEERFSYTSIGDPVNLASRLESLNKLYGTSILVGEKTYESIGSEFRCRLVDRVSVKGRASGSGIYELIDEQDLPADGDRLLARYGEALGWYFEGRFMEAVDSFQRILADFPQDCPSRTLLGRCERYLVHPPEGLWTGVTVLQDK